MDLSANWFTAILLKAAVQKTTQADFKSDTDEADFL